MIEKHILSKSTFIYGLQCPKRLYLHKHYPELKDGITPQQQEIFSRGTDVGHVARDLFPGGVDASPETAFRYEESIETTMRLIGEGTPVIYEAAFQFDRVLSAMDILVNDGGKWKAFEVKSSTGITDVYIMDTALQYYVISNSGIDLDDISIVHLNNQYVRDGELDVRGLFTIESVLEKVREKQEEIGREIERLKAVAALEADPDTDIGEHCSDPYDCDFMGHCWKHIPEDSVFDITRMRKSTMFSLYRQGIVRQVDVPSDYLNYNQMLQVECRKNGKPFIDNEGISAFLDTLTYPMCFMDFETFMPAIPLFDNSRPYQQITFQYSLHYLPSKDGELKHFEFLGEAGKDPRKDFIASLLSDTASPGIILVYNRAFEETRLRELAEDFPEFAPDIRERLSRIVDLMLPFQKKYVYMPAMKGSYSIKKVLPALVPELNYDGLAISNGGLAMEAYGDLQDETDPGKIAEVRTNLLEYCRMDTLAMVELVRWLEGSLI